MVETIADVFRDAYANGGGTYFVSVQRNRIQVGKSVIGSGYYVATEGNEWCVSRNEFGQGTIDAFVIQNFRKLTDNGNYYLGIWQSESGRWYLDISEHFREATHAIAYGISRGQLAIWDIAKGCEIATSGNPIPAMIGDLDAELIRY